MTLLVVVAVAAEARAVAHGQPGLAPVITGVGPAAAAAATARALATSDYEGVLNLGVAGAVRATVGEVLVADRVVAADLGSEGPDGVLTLEDLGFGPTALPTDPALTARVLGDVRRAGIREHRGDILTVWTTTGRATTARRLRARYPEAIGEAMEGYGVALAAVEAGVPFAEVRTVSNVIGPRDPASWDLAAALETLRRVAEVLDA